MCMYTLTWIYTHTSVCMHRIKHAPGAQIDLHGTLALSCRVCCSV